MYQLIILVLIFTIALVAAAWIYSIEIPHFTDSDAPAMSSEEVKRAVEEHFGASIQLTPQEKRDVEKNFGAHN